MSRRGRTQSRCPQVSSHLQGRVAILKVHARGKAISKDVDYEKIARRTPGFTGADLQNLMNEAAIMAARRGLTEISKEEVADALERIIAGPEKVGPHWIETCCNSSCVDARNAVCCDV
jgi:cell division protease FtsH